MNQPSHRPAPIPFIALALALTIASPARAADYVPFHGPASAWHGFDRHDFILDEQALSITPTLAPATEGNGIKPGPKGQRRCLVVSPKTPGPGNPWSWRGCYWDHQPQAEVELLKRGFHIAYVMADADLKPDATWDAWYAFLTEKHGLSPKPALLGMSRGGEYAYTWATAHPDKVSCVYADNPGSNREMMMRLGDLARADVPLLHVCGSIDPLLARNSRVIETTYQQLGGRISVMIKEGAGHHPHSLRDPTPIADFITQSVAAASTQPSAPPDYVGKTLLHNWFYGDQSSYSQFASEGMDITCRGPMFFPSYDRYLFALPGVEGAVTVIEPNHPAPGNPWAYRADAVTRDDAVALGVLAAGFRIVTGPVPYNADAPRPEHWDATYKHLIAHGFSPKVVMCGVGGAAAHAYAWATAHPDYIACIYVENPLLKTPASTGPQPDGLATLAKANVPILHVCGELDPHLTDNTRALESRYKELGGRISVILNAGKGHFPTGPTDPRPVIDFILRSAKPVTE